MIKVLKFLSLLLFPLFALKAEIHLDQFPEKESSQKMFAVIYQGYLKPGKENEYQDAWNKVAQYFIEYRGAIGSCLHRTSDGLWVAYSRWPDKKTRDNSWPGENAPSEELPLEIRNAVLTIKDCLDSDRKIPDLCMEVVNDLLLLSNDTESSFVLSPEQERILNLVYEEVEIAIQEGNPPFAAIITNSENNILAVAHNQANTKQLAIAHAEIEAIQLACKLLGKKKLDGCTLYANAESCGMCSTAIIKSGITQIFYGAPHEKGSNPDVHLLEINKKATPQLSVQGGFMREKFIEQINRGRNHAGQKESGARQETTIKDFGNVLLKESKIGQFDDRIGAFANRDFKKGEVVIKWDLKALSEDEYEKLPQYEKENFCHHRNGICWLYPDPERHVNRFSHPNVVPDFDKQTNIALRDIIKGEELSIADNTVEDF